MIFKLSIKMKLVLIVGLLSVLLVVSAVWGIIGLKSADQRSTRVYETEIVPMQQYSEIYQLALLQSGVVFDTLRYWTDKTEIARRTEHIRTLRTSMQTLRDAYQQAAQVPEAQPIVEHFFTHLATYDAAVTEAMSFLEKGNPSGALVIVQAKLRPASVALQEDVGQMNQLLRRTSKDERDQSAGAYRTTLTAMLVLLIVGPGAAIIAGWLLINSILLSLREAGSLAEAISRGELGHSMTATSDDEIGELMQALGKMDDSLTGIVGAIGLSVNELSTTSEEMARGNRELSDRTQAQAGALEQTAASMEEMTSTVKQNSESATQANALASSALTVAEDGKQAMQHTVLAMQKINDSSVRISEIITVIDNIAFQTNILALNAAVEAARAGDQGRGFAVVASEVRSLAQRSATAAKEISVLIHDSEHNVAQGNALVQQSGQTLSDIVERVGRLRLIVAEMAQSNHEQADGIDQVGKAVIQMDDMTQQNAALVEQASASSQTISERAQDLAREVAIFRVKQPGAPASRTLSLAVPS